MLYLVCRPLYTQSTLATSIRTHIWHGVYYPRKVPLQLTFERYVWHTDYYPHKVASQLPFRRYL